MNWGTIGNLASVVGIISVAYGVVRHFINKREDERQQIIEEEKEKKRIEKEAEEQKQRERANKDRLKIQYENVLKKKKIWVKLSTQLRNLEELPHTKDSNYDRILMNNQAIFGNAYTEYVEFMNDIEQICLGINAGDFYGELCENYIKTEILPSFACYAKAQVTFVKALRVIKKKYRINTVQIGYTLNIGMNKFLKSHDAIEYQNIEKLRRAR